MTQLITVDTQSPKEVQQTFRRINKAMVKGLVSGLREESRDLRKHVVKTHLSGAGTDADANRKNQKLRRRTGEMVRKTKTIPVKDLGGGLFQGGITFDAKYAGVHVGEKGKVTIITPKSKKWLTIPLPPALTRAGVLREPARDMKDLFFLPRKGKNPLLVKQVGGKKGRLQAFFVLSKMVRIRTRIHPKEILRSRKQKIVATIRRHMIENVARVVNA